MIQMFTSDKCTLHRLMLTPFVKLYQHSNRIYPVYIWFYFPQHTMLFYSSLSLTYTILIHLSNPWNEFTRYTWIQYIWFYLSHFIDDTKNFWNCINDKSCPINVTKSHSTLCACANATCAKIICKGIFKTSQLKINCTIEVHTEETQECLNYLVVNKLNGKGKY